MYAEPPGFDRDQLAATLRQAWGIAAQDLRYVPVGFGTHHYRAGSDRWVNVDVTPDVHRLDKGLRGVVALAEAGLEFVHAPLRRIEGGGCVAAHAGNVMTTPDGGIKLIDWDTVRLGPPERDLWMIPPRDEGEWAAYGPSGVDPEAIELYRRWWALSEICEFVTTLRAPHADDANTRIAWRELQNYLSSSSSQPTTGSPNCA